MHLRRLELQGFKSFASRTEFAFPTGITAIVGPNGSGKSNVADAIRWALGEQSVRALRGSSTSDMIFSGASKRAQAGLAEVSVTLDNSDGWLPVDYTEVTIGRRAHRSGDNEYILNDTKVRLRDIDRLLAESGLGQRSYTVIGQGLVDAALSQRPQERRALFEEAAGVAAYRAERERAARQLDETGRNLERVQDILGEISPRLKRLEKQADRYREYERISAHLLRQQRTWYGFHWGQAQDRLRTSHERERALDNTLSIRRQKVDEISNQLGLLRHHQTELRASLRDSYRQTADLHDQMDTAQQELAALTERVSLLADQREELLQGLDPLLVQLESQEQRTDATHTELDEIKSKVTAQEERVTAMEQELDSLREQMVYQADQRAQIGIQIESLQDRRQELETALSETTAAQTRLEAEQSLLAQMREEGSVLTQGARSIIQANLPGVKGLLGALIHVPQEWETAIEAALGPRAQAVVVRDWQVVSEARQALEQDQRAILFPLTELEADSVQKIDIPPDETLCAADIVSCESDLRTAVGLLLGNTLLVDDLATAKALKSGLLPGTQCVTRFGEIVSSSGTVTIGNGSGGILSQERTWRELPQKLEDLKHQQAKLETEMSQIADKLSTLSVALAEVELAETEATQAVTQAEGGPLVEARTDLAVARQALQSQQLLLQRETTELERLKSQTDARRAQAEDVEKKQASAQERLSELQKQTTEFKHELGQVRAQIGPAEDELTRLTEEQEQVEAAERTARTRVRQMEERVNTSRLETVRNRDRLDQLQERILEDLGLVELEVTDEVTAQTPLPLRPLVSQLPVVDELPEGIEQEIRRQKARLRQLGPINPGSHAEYSETLERHQFLTEQVTDLRETSSRLREVISELDELMKVAFRETFAAIATEFESTFTTLFNGGSARLELTDPDDMMLTGVDIVARPPGKRLQGLALLSGGERSLTAAALIFAILRVCPTPFCVLDEVDAMLDEANVARFRTMLKELAAETQVVIITHNRHTVEAADNVYGVSMGSDGISKIVSLKLEGQEQAK
jgi:chromosome segregation protein